MMTRRQLSNRSMRRAAVTLLAAAALYEAVAYSGFFPRVLLPTIETIVVTLYGMLADGTIIAHSAATLYRVMFGFCLAIAVGLPLGIAMARFKPVENFFLPLVSALMPIPSFALVPLFMLWFGIGNVATVLVVVYASVFPLLYQVWAGVRAVNPLWVRAATVMNANASQLFGLIIWPAALPFIITGLRLSFGRAWIAVIGGTPASTSMTKDSCISSVAIPRDGSEPSFRMPPAWTKRRMNSFAFS